MRRAVFLLAILPALLAAASPPPARHRQAVLPQGRRRGAVVVRCRPEGQEGARRRLPGHRVPGQQPVPPRTGPPLQDVCRQGRGLRGYQQQRPRHADAPPRPCPSQQAAFPRPQGCRQRRGRRLRGAAHARGVRSLARRQDPLSGPHRRPDRHRLPPQGGDPARPGRGPRRDPGRQAGERAVHRCAGLPDRAGDHAQGHGQGHLRQGGRAHPPEPLPGMPPGRAGRADAAHDVRGSGVVVGDDRGSAGRRPHAALARRSQARQVRQRPGDPEGGERDSAGVDQGRLPQGRRQGHAAGQGVRRGLGHRQAGHRDPDAQDVRRARRDAGARRALPVFPGADEVRGGSLDPGGGGASRRARGGPPHHRLHHRSQEPAQPPRSRGGRHRHRLPDQATRRATARSSWSRARPSACPREPCWSSRCTTRRMAWPARTARRWASYGPRSGPSSR